MAFENLQKNLKGLKGWLFQAGRAAQDVVVIKLLPSHTGKALNVLDSSGSSVFSIAADGDISGTGLAVEAGAIGTTELADDAVTSDKIDSGVIQTASVTLTAAEILDLADTPITLVAAPGAGNMLQLVSAGLFLNHAGTGFAENADNLEIHYENEAGAAATGAIEMTGFIDQTADSVLLVAPIAPVVRAATAVVNKALVLTNINDDFTDAGTTTSTLKVIIHYRVLASGF